MKYYIIAGEASGDLHGSHLLKAIKKIDPNATLRGWGGDLMQAAGCTLVKHYKELAFMAFWEVLKNIGTIFRNLSLCKNDIRNFQPAVVVLIDYPGFNLRIAAWAKKNGFKVVYYISPKVWAWKSGRVKKMKKCIDILLVIFPFEKAYFKTKWNWDVTYVGNPLTEIISENITINVNKSGNIIALLPGSRKQEISVQLPIMLQVCALFPQYHFVVSKAPGQSDDFYMPFIAQYPNVATTRDTYALLEQSKVALVTSGTATLETALFNVPQVVCYKGSAISYAIAKRLVKLKYISLVNLIMDKPIVTELIQYDLTKKNLVAQLTLLLENKMQQNKIEKDYAELRNLLSLDKHASEKAAAQVYAVAKK